ncbi:MAG TPA: hypothetical protein VGN87_03430 [Paenibacillus sp.]
MFQKVYIWGPRKVPDYASKQSPTLWGYFTASFDKSCRSLPGIVRYRQKMGSGAFFHKLELS